MTKRIARAMTLLGVAGTIVIGGAGIANASHGADDPPGHHRHHHHAGERHHHGHHHHRHHGEGRNHR